MNNVLTPRIIVEGPNGVGKSSVCRMLSDRLGIQMHSPFATRRDIYELWFKDPRKALEMSVETLKNMPSSGVFDRFHLTPQTMVNHPLTFLPIMSENDITVCLDADLDTLRKRLMMKGSPEDVDAEGFYRPHYARLANDWNAMFLSTDNLSVEDICALVSERLQAVLDSKSYLMKEGRSKAIYRQGNKVTVVLKPTLDSYTHGKSQVLPGTDILRNRFFEKAVRVLQSANIPVIGYSREGLSSYSCEYCYSIPFECIVKTRATGTTLVDSPGLFYPDMPFLYPVVRFDYRTSPRDIPAPRSYILNYGMDPNILEEYAIKAFSALELWLKNSGYELVDICFVFGFSSDGKVKIISEISPDGMRVRRMGKSFDKDLFREGAPGDEIIRAWTRLIDDLE